MLSSFPDCRFQDGPVEFQKVLHVAFAQAVQDIVFANV